MQYQYIDRFHQISNAPEPEQHFSDKATPTTEACMYTYAG